MIQNLFYPLWWFVSVKVGVHGLYSEEVTLPQFFAVRGEGLGEYQNIKMTEPPEIWETKKLFPVSLHPGRAKLLCMLTKMIHKYTTVTYWLTWPNQQKKYYVLFHTVSFLLSATFLTTWLFILLLME